MVLFVVSLFCRFCRKFESEVVDDDVFKELRRLLNVFFSEEMVLFFEFVLVLLLLLERLEMRFWRFVFSFFFGGGGWLFGV